MNDARALAAEVLASVVRGTSLRDALAPAQAQLADPRDRAFLTALASEGARWWLRFDAALDALMDKPLRKREPTLHALLVLGLVQLEVLQSPPHAAVAASVEATRALGRGGFAKLVNAVLRRWLRERAAHNAALDMQPATRHAHPRWLLEALRRDWPADCDRILAANNAAAPPMLRVNRRRATREEVGAELKGDGIHAQPHAWLADALVLDAHADLAHRAGFAQGRYAVQDGAAQIAADLLDPREGEHVLDACAAPGGKACHLLERSATNVLALERDTARAASIRANLARLGLAADVRVGDAGNTATWWDGHPFDRILLDAPCSATGVIRRHPDIKLHRRAADIAPLAASQQHLLESLWPTLRPGGCLLYATCSVLHAENIEVIDAFRARHADAHAQAIALPAGRALGAGWQLLPGEGGLDGMFYARLHKAV